MKRTLLVIILCTCAAIASGQDVPNLAVSSNLMSIPINPFKQEFCHKKIVKNEIYMNIKNNSCRPREKLVELVASDEYMYYPSHVFVQRCQGSCQLKVTCMPTRTELTQIRVRRQSLIDFKKSTCGHVEVEQHLMCNCTCQVMAKHCNENQVYMPHSCMCMCKNIEEKHACVNSRVKTWDESSCQCLCLDAQECGPGEFWNENTCTCE